jgi:hypothetical protein
MPGRARQPKKRGAPSKIDVQDRIWTRVEKVGHCEVGHETGLVKSDKDSVSMVQCIDVVRTHRCAPLPPPWGPKDQREGGMEAVVRGVKNPLVLKEFDPIISTSNCFL